MHQLDLNLFQKRYYTLKSEQDVWDKIVYERENIKNNNIS